MREFGIHCMGNLIGEWPQTGKSLLQRPMPHDVFGPYRTLDRLGEGQRLRSTTLPFGSVSVSGWVRGVEGSILRQ